MPVPVLNFPTNNDPGMLEKTNLYMDFLTKAIENQRRSIALRYEKSNQESKLAEAMANADFNRARSQNLNISNRYLPQELQQGLYKSMLENESSRVKNQYLEPDLKEKLAQAILKNKLDEVKLKYEPGMLEAKLRNEELQPNLTRAHIESLLASAAKARDQFGDATGVVGQAFKLEKIKNKFGEDSAVYQNAKRAFEAEIGLKEGRNTFFTANVGYKNLPDLTKEQLESQYLAYKDNAIKNNQPVLSLNDWVNVVHGASSVNNSASMPIQNVSARKPESSNAVNNIPIRDDINLGIDYANMAEEAKSNIYKKTGVENQIQPSIQMRNAYALLKSYDPKNLAGYSGPSGTTKYLTDMGQALVTGKAPNDALRALNAFKDISQLIIIDAERSGYKTSVTPTMINNFEDQLKSLYKGTTTPDQALLAYHTLGNALKDYAIQTTHASRRGAAPITESHIKEYEKEVQEEASRVKNNQQAAYDQAMKDFSNMNNSEKVKASPIVEAFAKREGISTEQAKRILNKRGIL